MLIRIVGAIVVIWLAFMLIGAIFSIFKWVLVIGAVVTVGAIAYGAVKRAQIKS